MQQAIERALRYTAGLSFEAFAADDLRVDAVLRNVSILGEAASRVRADVRSLAPEVEWGRITRSRHIIVHDYFGVDLEIVWRILTVHLPEVQAQLAALLDRLPAP